eukprot:TRINITY_DN1869_c0_g1_i1.p1 TRINITY_DN1869_c0_g1~~TRINITY_DN1869_c0_g1_i1.p1  ORF type:complete len:163 (+),score=40.23 TRINITY_DN1869_c0_g1_i1:145-633(+)
MGDLQPEILRKIASAFRDIGNIFEQAASSVTGINFAIAEEIVRDLDEEIASGNVLKELENGSLHLQGELSPIKTPKKRGRPPKAPGEEFKHPLLTFDTWSSSELQDFLDSYITEGKKSADELKNSFPKKSPKEVDSLLSIVRCYAGDAEDKEKPKKRKKSEQ